MCLSVEGESYGEDGVVVGKLGVGVGDSVGDLFPFLLGQNVDLDVYVTRSVFVSRL